VPTDDRVALTDDPEREVSGMGVNEDDPRGFAGRCEYAWCTTEHGATVHPDDEVHRSGGVGFPARVRGGAERGPGIATDVEIGVLRRPSDTENWLVIEVAGGGLAMTAEGARALRRALVDDPQIQAALSP